MTPISDDEFENYLRRQTDDHRMYPSDKLWRNIQLTLHGESRWPALTYISILIIAALTASTLLVKPEERMKKNAVAYASDYAYNAAKERSTAARSNAAQNNSPLQHAYAEKITQNTIEAVTKKLYENQLANNPQPALYKNDATIIITKTASLPLLATPVAKASPQLVISNTAVASGSDDKMLAEQAAPARQASMYFSTLGLIHFGGLKPNNGAHLYNADNEEIWRKFALINPRDIIRKNLSKFSFQFYITPSVSYRRLTDAKGKAARFYTAIPLSANYKIDINNVVKHTPSAGAEVGFALGYKLNEKFTVKSGIQFNIRQYNIEAYSRPAPPPALQSDETIGAATPDVSVDAAYAISSDYIQNSGKQIILRNRYYETAVPIGIDWKVLTANNGMLTLNVAAALQPTYTFDKEPFVITTDYKKYTDGSAIMRNWNVNSSMEAYITYKVGPLRWQIGPQFRYQYLPTYGGGYPIREHLLDYGLKIGFTKALD